MMFATSDIFAKRLDLSRTSPQVITTSRKTLKVLAIGNSFSMDAMQFVYQIARDAGYDTITLGNLYIGGCSLQRHYENIQSDKAEYRYYKNTDGTWRLEPNKTLYHGLIDEAWDYITMQQASRFSGIEASYDPYLQGLIAYVERYKQNRSAKLAWHMTWAYQQDYQKEWFDAYHRDQQRMYRDIVTTVQKKPIATHKFFTVIPCGTAVQNMRTSLVGDTLTRDGFHLDYKLGRYIAGLTYFSALTGDSVADILYRPDHEKISLSYMPLIKTAVQRAIADPYKISDLSSFLTN